MQQVKHTPGQFIIDGGLDGPDRATRSSHLDHRLNLAHWLQEIRYLNNCNSQQRKSATPGNDAILTRQCSRYDNGNVVSFINRIYNIVTSSHLFLKCLFPAPVDTSNAGKGFCSLVIVALLGDKERYHQKNHALRDSNKHRFKSQSQTTVVRRCQRSRGMEKPQ